MDIEPISIDIEAHMQEQHAGKDSQSIKSIAYGGVDGVITTFSIIASAYGASLDYNIIIIMGLSNLIADGFSMGFGDYISSRLENNYIKSELKKETYEFHNNIDFEKQELIVIYKKRFDVTDGDAKQIVNIMSKYKRLFLQNMMRNELNLESEPCSNKELRINSLYTFLSFEFFGFLPILVYLIGFGITNKNPDVIFIISGIVSACTLFLVGAIVACITKQNHEIYKNGCFTLGNGLIAFSIAYFIGWRFDKLLV